MLQEPRGWPGIHFKRVGGGRAASQLVLSLFTRPPSLRKSLFRGHFYPLDRGVHQGGMERFITGDGAADIWGHLAESQGKAAKPVNICAQNTVRIVLPRSLGASASVADYGLLGGACWVTRAPRGSLSPASPWLPGVPGLRGASLQSLLLSFLRLPVSVSSYKDPTRGLGPL